MILSPRKNKQRDLLLLLRSSFYCSPTVNLKPVGYARRREDSKETRHHAAAETSRVLKDPKRIRIREIKRRHDILPSMEQEEEDVRISLIIAIQLYFFLSAASLYWIQIDPSISSFIPRVFSLLVDMGAATTPPPNNRTRFFDNMSGDRMRRKSCW